MGVVENVDYDQMPRQGSFLGKRVQVCFKYQSLKRVSGTVVRDDAEDPFVTILSLDDGRVVLATECQYSVDL